MHGSLRTASLPQIHTLLPRASISSRHLGSMPPPKRYTSAPGLGLYGVCRIRKGSEFRVSAATDEIADCGGRSCCCCTS